MFSSIRARLWLSYAALVVAALAIVTAVVLVFLLRNPFVYRQTFVRLKAAESLLMREPRAAGRIDAVAQAFDVRVLLFKADGQLIEDSEGTRAALPTSSLRRTARNQATVRDANGNPWLYSQVRLGDGTWLLIAAPRPKLLPALNVLGDELWGPLFRGGLLALLLALVLAYLLARWIADPLQQLIGAAREVSAPAEKAAGGSDRQPAYVRTQGRPDIVAERGPQEVRELTRAFNAMLERVDASQRAQRDFVANVSHELKTPLTSIQGFAQALLDGTAASPESRRQAAEVIHREAGRMHRLALDLLDLARLDSGTAEMKIARVDVGALLQAVTEKFRPLAAGAGIDLELSIMGGLPATSGDADRLAQVFSNLVDNALKFTPRDGSITVRALQDNGEIQVSVTDTGPGIAVEDIPRIFDRFFQADSARGGGEKHGAGLGLAIAREIIVAHGGRITVRSAKGRGAEFIVHLATLARRAG